MRIHSLVTLSALLIFSSCVTGKRAEDKTDLDRLNGGNSLTESAGAVNIVPVFPVYSGDQVAHIIKVSGIVWRGDGISRSALAGATVQIKKNGKVLGETTSQSNGEYKLFQVLNNSSYVLFAQIEGLTKEIPFEVKGYIVQGLDISLGPP